MTISAHDIEAWLGTIKLGVIDARITLDETWNPYAQASITIPLNKDLIDVLDPRTGARLKLYTTQSYGVSDKLSAISSEYGKNYLYNPNFETDYAGWYFGGGTTNNTRTTARYHTGTASLKTTITSTTGNGTVASHYFSNFSKASPIGQTTGFVWVYAAAGATYNVRLREITTGGSLVTNGTTVFMTGTGGWQKVTIPTINKAQANSRVQILLTFTTLGDYWIDTAQVQTGSTPTDFVNSQLRDLTDKWAGQTIGDLSAWYFAPYNASGSNTLATLSSLYGGDTIADITADWDGLYFWEVSELYSRSYPSGIYNNYKRSFDLAIRSRTVNIDAATITLELASDEASLQDYALVQDINYQPASTDLRTIVKGVLARIDAGLVAGTATATVSANATIWAPGQTAWDYLASMLSQAKLRLFCDERRRWYLVEDTYTADGLVELFSNETITTATEIISRDNDEWYDSVVVKYTWTNDLGATVTSYDTAAVDGYQKTKLIEIQSLYPGAGAAQRILDRALSRGITKDVTAVGNYRVTPSTECKIYITGYPTENGFVRSVTWNLPGDEMTVTTRQPVTT